VGDVHWLVLVLWLPFTSILRQLVRWQLAASWKPSSAGADFYSLYAHTGRRNSSRVPFWCTWPTRRNSAEEGFNSNCQSTVASPTVSKYHYWMELNQQVDW